MLTLISELSRRKGLRLPRGSFRIKQQTPGGRPFRRIAPGWICLGVCEYVVFHVSKNPNRSVPRNPNPHQEPQKKLNNCHQGPGAGSSTSIASSEPRKAETWSVPRLAAPNLPRFPNPTSDLSSNHLWSCHEASETWIETRVEASS